MPSLNSIMMSILTALIVAAVTGIAAENLIEPQKAATNAYPIAGAAAPAAAAAEAKPADTGPVPLTAEQLAKADPAKGADTAKKCQQCHNLEKGAAAKVGPPLYGVVGRDRASVAGFSYSDGLKKLGGKWTVQDLSAFLTKPSAFVQGTKMSFAGIAKAEDRADVIAYLNKNGDAPVDLSKAQ